MNNRRHLMIFTVLGCLFSAGVNLGNDRQVPEIPPPGQRLRVIIDTDAACEIDDHYAVALALLAPERFEIEGFVGAHFGDSGGPWGVEKSVGVVRRILEEADMAGEIPVKKLAERYGGK